MQSIFCVHAYSCKPYLQAQLQRVTQVLRDLVHADAAHGAHSQRTNEGVWVPRILQVPSAQPCSLQAAAHTHNGTGQLTATTAKAALATGCLPEHVP